MAGNMTNDYKTVKGIITRKQVAPTIVNESSKFVVVTYWWGRNKDNLNTMRPCTAFYETFVLQLENFLMKMLKVSLPYVKKQSDPRKMMEAASLLDEFAANDEQFKKAVQLKAKVYQDMMFQDLDINLKLPLNEKEEIASRKINQMKEGRGKWKGVKAGAPPPGDYKVKTLVEIEGIFDMLMREVMHLIKKKVFQIYILKEEAKELKKKYYEGFGGNKLEPADKRRISELNTQITNVKNEIRATAKNKQIKFQETVPVDGSLYFKNPEFKKYEGKNIYDILGDHLRYLAPVQFQEMIDKWESACRDNNCNFLSVEYPEFADRSDGYQLAINAKPLFIQKALESCNGRAVLYIDGDMFIRKYPQIFDMRDEIDFMARGWYVDPRSSYNINESITYDPYTFETSGGIMWFSTSDESKMLLEKWSNTAGSKSQSGRADDRVLSLVFNSFKMLCPMKIIPLPVEYLWLTLDYDERMLEHIYEWDYDEMEKTIFVEHSECLTTEESAGAAGAASDRSAKFAGFLDEENIDPVSEKYHEFLNFPNKDMLAGMKQYLNYMKGTHYFNDGNEKLINKGFINMGEDETSNEQPLYITNFDDKWGNDPYFNDSSLTYNEIAKMHETELKRINPKDYNVEDEGDVVIINDFTNLMKEGVNLSSNGSKKLSNTSRNKTQKIGGNSKNRFAILPIDPTPESKDGSLKKSPLEKKLQHRIILSLIIKLLNDGKKVVLTPTYYGKKYNGLMYGRLRSMMTEKCKNCELIYSPLFNNPGYKYSSTGFFKAEIDLTAPIMFAPSKFLINFLKMFISVEDISIYIGNGSYELMSRVRVGYNIEKKLQAPPVPANSPISKSLNRKSGLRSGSKGGNKKRANTASVTIINRDIDKYHELMGLKTGASHSKTGRKPEKNTKNTRNGSKRNKTRKR